MTSPKSMILDTNQNRKVFQVYLLSLVDKVNITGLISILFRHGNPSTVFFAVAHRTINSIQSNVLFTKLFTSVLIRSIHILHKVVKVKPMLCCSNALSSVSQKVFGSFVSSTSQHSSPTKVKSSVGHSMPEVVWVSYPATPTRFSATTPQISNVNYSFVATCTQTRPIRTLFDRMKRLNRKFAKSLSGQIELSHSFFALSKLVNQL